MHQVDKDRSLQLQAFVNTLGEARTPFVETGRKFDKVFVDGAVRYFVARVAIPNKGVEVGDIFGAKSKLAPNLRWYFGKLENIDKWDWSGYHGKPVNDPSVVQTKAYATYVHYMKVPA